MQPHTTHRPWGEFRQFAHNEPVTVKTILVKKGERLSLQYHAHRSEFWKILKGSPLITIGEEKHTAEAGDEFTVPVHMQHCIEALESDVELLEIARGTFDENDIVRLDDKYGRV